MSYWKKTVNVKSSEPIRKLCQTLEIEGQKQYPDLQLLAALRMELEKACQEEESFWKQKYLLLEGMQTRFTNRMYNSLSKPVTDAEIKHAVKAIKSDSAPGIDGMTGQLFQRYRSITGAQVTKEVKEFFESGVMPTDWNHTQQCLLPKVPNAKQMKDLRPISLFSVVYKIILKVLSNRLKGILPRIFSPTQGAFVAGRLTSDNLLTAHEMIHGLKTNPNCRGDYIAIKTNISKAYDKVEWDFLETLFAKLGFAGRWIEWVMSCVRAEQNGSLTGMKLTRNCPSVQHFLFADDSMFPCKASLCECTELIRCLKLHEDSSDQVINFQKSAISFGANIDPVMRRLLAEILQIENKGGNGNYLGLLECFLGSKHKLLAFIGEKLNERLRGWFAKKLSHGGKEVLLNSIAMVLPVYAMSCFRLTKHHCQKIMSEMASFWWAEDGDKKKIHWIAWKNICVPKDKGDLGFRDIEDFNQGLLAKQAWKLHNEPNSLLMRVYRGRYYSASSFLECELIGDDGKWKIDTLEELFPPNEVQRIKQIILGNMDDKEIWAFNKAGDYSVKSGCSLLRKLAENAGEEGMVHDQAMIELKKQIWRMRTIPKIRTFVWRAASGALAVAERLTAHGMPVEMTCMLCHQGIETIEHVLFQCTKAQELWSEFDLTSGHSFHAGTLTELLNESLEEETLWHELNRVESSGITMPNDLGVPK
ncbi:uncharacterized protein LOC125578115 [Brassica napus]|uniref:uncharacterized protein LOC125578115 n=1 Tax=Brassica napus TaxID=3708 RepID=UPI002078DD29|nr:uncharacterized protein LOC125578115 [Brassica napus]